MRNKLIFIFALLLSTTIFAQTPSANPLLNAAGLSNQSASAFPANCTTNQGYTFQGKELLLNSPFNATTPQRVFLLHNTTNGIVMINHQVSNPGASAGWGSEINPNQWSAIVVTQPTFSLVCMAYIPPRLGFINCTNALSICSLPATSQTLGTFWLAENQPLPKLLNTLIQRGALKK